MRKNRHPIPLRPTVPLSAPVLGRSPSTGHSSNNPNNSTGYGTSDSVGSKYHVARRASVEFEDNMKECSVRSAGLELSGGDRILRSHSRSWFDPAEFSVQCLTRVSSGGVGFNAHLLFRPKEVVNSAVGYSCNIYYGSTLPNFPSCLRSGPPRVTSIPIRLFFFGRIDSVNTRSKEWIRS